MVEGILSAPTAIFRYRTALTRTNLSRPLRLVLEDGLLLPTSSLLDYGCGRGGDLRELRERGFHCDGWDPAFRPNGPRSRADVVNLGYVINVIEDPVERTEAVQSAWGLADQLLVVSARLAAEARDHSDSPFADGIVTRSGTFQKFFLQHELRDWLEKATGAQSVAAGPGIFYVFKDPKLRESFVASRYRSRSSVPRIRRSSLLFEEHREILEPLMNFVTSRGRLPEHDEISSAEIRRRFGSIRKAFSLIRQVTGRAQWDAIRDQRSQDLLLYLALVRFDGRPRYSALPRELQLDARAFFSTYKRACEIADALLFSVGDLSNVDAACRKSPIGKLTPSALYVHVSGLSSLPQSLRVYEGCARGYIGAVDGANIVKLSRLKPQVSYLSYPDFDSDPHPALMASLVVPLQTFHVQYRDYRGASNPFILHRKEELVASSYPSREKFSRLTRQEEKLKLFERPENIGTREKWTQTLADRRVRLRGHRLVRLG